MAGPPAGTGAAQGEAVSAATTAFEAVGIPTPRLDAEVLLCGITGRDRSSLIATPEAELTSAQSRAFSTAVRRRLRREPVAYILGRQGFRHIDLAVDPRVLIPRPETELLVELALEVGPRRVLDIGTGSGAIALAVADELPGCEVVANDVSAEALEVARANARDLGLDGRVELHHGSLPPAGGFDLILSNLPYVETGERLMPEVAQWEPAGALYAGPDGLDAFEQVLGDLAPAGIEAPAIGLEIGQGQADAVAGLVRKAGFPEIEIRADLAGIDRVVTGRAARPTSPD